VARVRELLHYDPETGELRWRVDIRSGRNKAFLCARAGEIAGYVMKSNGYHCICVDLKKYLAHRVAFLIVEGRWPLEIDHVDGRPLNNAWANLREVDHRTNTENERRARRHSTHGILGVSKNRKRWKAQIMVAGAARYLGTYDTPEAAHQVYLEAKRELHVGCTI
jgi:hypothetical protein